MTPEDELNNGDIIKELDEFASSFIKLRIGKSEGVDLIGRRYGPGQRAKFAEAQMLADKVQKEYNTKLGEMVTKGGRDLAKQAVEKQAVDRCLADYRAKQAKQITPTVASTVKAIQTGTFKP